MRIRQFVVNQVAHAGGQAVKMPSERELCRKFDVARGTVRRAMEDLVREGYLVPKRGMGTFVNPRKTADNPAPPCPKVGVILSSGMLVNITGNFQQELAGVFAALARHEVSVQFVNFTARQPADTLADVTALGFDGLLWLHPPALHPEMPEYFFAHCDRLVVVNSWALPGWKNVVLDDYQGAMLKGAAELIAQAGADVAFVGRDDSHPDARQVYAAFEGLFAQRGLQRPPEYTIPADDIARPLRRLLRTRHPRAVYSQGGGFGRAAMEVLAREHDCLPPGFVFLCQDVPEMERLPPAIKVRRIAKPDYFKLGKAGMLKLLTLMNPAAAAGCRPGVVKIPRSEKNNG